MTTFIGQVTYILRDKNTEAVIDQHTQDNIITESLYYRLRDTWQLGLNVVVTNAVMEPSRFTHMFPGTGTQGVVTSYPSRQVPALGAYAKSYPAVGAANPYVQFAGRYDAPAIGSSRTIASIGLAAPQSTFYATPAQTPDTTTTNLAYNAGTIPNTMAFLKLTTPCVQTDQQVLDVYYRLVFPSPVSVDSLPSFMYSERLIGTDWVSTNYGSFPTTTRKFPFKLPKVKAADVGLTLTPYKSQFNSSGPTQSNGLHWLAASSGPAASTSLPGTRVFGYTDAAFTDYAGQMISSVLFASSVPTYTSNLTKTSKIQNVIGTGVESTNPLSPSFLDVDNLPTGTGKVSILGTWNNIATPSSPGLYYPSVISEYNRIKITTSGAVGVSQYKIVRQKFFGYLHKSTTAINSYYRYTDHLIPALCASLPTSTAVLQYDNNKSLVEDVTDTYFSTPQISSCCKYDDSSFVFVKRNMIILYSVGGADYWKYTAAYTDIHQVAVVSGKIYIACRNTGLWVIDPYNSLTPTNITSPAAGIDTSACHGVAKGNGNVVWVVASNCLTKYDGSVWTKYDSTTTPAFSMAGISDNNWSNVEYIKVDEDSSTNQMLLVRKFNASVNPTLLGVWWSTAGTASNTGAETAPTGVNIGRSRKHRGHVGGLGGYWIALIQNQWYRMSFGGSTFTSMTNVAAYVNFNSALGNTYGVISYNIFQSATFVKTLANQVRSWHADGVTVLSALPVTTSWDNGILQYSQKTIDPTGAVETSYTTTTSGLTSPCYQSFGSNSIGNSDGNSYMYPRSTTISGYLGGADMSHNFILCPGVMVTVTADYNTQGYPCNLTTRIMNFGLDYTQGGGTMNYTAQQEYGWNGTSWELNNPNGKPTHATTDPLFDGLTISFTEGSSGTSFQTSNVYKFGLCEGILKDNATRATYNATPYYFRKTTSGVTDLELTTIPSSRAGQTGIVGIDPTNKSANATVNANNEVLFPGQNVRQYAVGDKPLIGDFVLSIDVTNLNATDVKNAACIGVTRRDYVNNGMQYFGFICSAGSLYSYDAGTTTLIAAIAAGTTTSLEIRRVSGVLSLWRNGASVKTLAGTGIRTADYILDVVYGVWDHRDTTYLPATGTRVPKATITSNGSAIYVNIGNSSLSTGRFSPRFFGIDFTTTGASVVTMNGATITPKTDGTAPAAGEITVDQWRGVMYFNSADIGKAITANYLHINS